jgi:hypothetical protein
MTESEGGRSDELRRGKAVRAEAGGSPVQTTHVLGAPPEEDDQVELDADDYEEIRQAVGRGAPTLLLGASTRSLTRNLAILKAVEQDHLGSPTRPEQDDSRSPTQPELDDQSDETDVHVLMDALSTFERSIMSSDLPAEVKAGIVRMHREVGGDDLLERYLSQLRQRHADGS